LFPLAALFEWAEASIAPALLNAHNNRDYFIAFADRFNKKSH
jgi:hypothetical protein